MEEKKKGIGLIGLIGMVISSCIGSGVFAITGQLAGVASPGAVLIAWLIVGACTQAFLIVLLFSADAYDFAFSMCTVAIVITWAFAAAYQAKWGVQNKNMVQAAIGFVAVAFQVIGVLFNGWSFLLLTCVGYIPGFFIYVKARKDYGNAITMGEKVCMGVVSALGVLSLVLLAMGVISI